MTLQIASLTLMGMLVVSQLTQAVTPMSRVSGQVIEDGTNRPVADARVFLVPDDERAAPDRSSPEVLSDRDGRYRFDMLTPVEVTVDNADVSDLRIVVTGSQ